MIANRKQIEVEVELTPEEICAAVTCLSPFDLVRVAALAAKAAMDIPVGQQSILSGMARDWDGKEWLRKLADMLDAK